MYFGIVEFFRRDTKLDRFLTKMVEIKNIKFCVKNLKRKRKKGQNFFDLSEQGFET